MISASEALGGRAAQVDLASCACVCLFWIAVLGSGKVGSCEIRAGKNGGSDVCREGSGIGVMGGIDGVWMSHVINLMKLALSHHTPNSNSPALFSSSIRA